ncbi:MAG: dUTP diphosphatase [Rickettsiales bacterium]|nr:dUTP diphosphatase [Rickettsiales bacterium]
MSDSSLLELKIKQLEHAQGLDLPLYATSGSAGMDLHAAVESDVVLQPGERKLIPAGIAIALPVGYEAQIRPRSGLAYKHGLTVLNSPGTIDSDYRGELKILLVNLGNDAFTVERGMRIAQMVISSYIQVAVVPSENLEESERGAGGFGSTGVHNVNTTHKSLEPA